MTQGNRLVGDSAMLILKTIRNYGNLVDCQKGFLVTVFVLQGAVTLSVDVRVVVRLGCGVHVLCVLARVLEMCVVRVCSGSALWDIWALPF